MSFTFHLKEAVVLLRNHKSLWVFGSAVFLPNLLLSLFSEDTNIGLICLRFIVSIVFSVLSQITLAGLIYTAHEGIENRATTFSDAWSRGKACFWRMVGLVIIALPSIALPSIFVAFLFYSVTTNDGAYSVLAWIGIEFSAILLGSWLFISACAVVIHDLRLLPAVWTGLLITLNNFWRILTIAGSIVVVRYVLLGISILVVSLSPYQIDLPTGWNYSAYQSILRDPIIRIIYNGVLWIGFIFTDVLLVSVYTWATKLWLYPAIVARQEAMFLTMSEAKEPAA
jgi:hypothetical protein